MGSMGADVLAEDMAANARLIAAAPDLLSALKAMMDDAEATTSWALAHAAIAKAESRVTADAA